MSARTQRLFFALTALVVVFAIVVRVILTAGEDEGTFGSNRLENVMNTFCFFTIFSNILVGLTTGLLATRLDRRQTWFRVLRLDGIVCIIVTAVVYHLLLSDTEELAGWAVVTNQMVHTVVPILAVIGWLAFGPRGQLSRRVALLSLVLPIVWLVLTLIRGAIIDFYPYDFLDPGVDGLGPVVITTGIIVVAFIAMAFGAIALDRLLSKTTESRSSS